MKMGILAAALVLVMVLPYGVGAEDQIRNESGVLIEIRQPFGGMTYAYDANRNFSYMVIGIPGNPADVVDYRDKYGVHTGIGGPGTYQWAVSPASQFGTTGQLPGK
ncbi:MAG: hypothetical protein WCG29_11190 [Desulfomonile sp.]|jgi:hypothetical protein